MVVKLLLSYIQFIDCFCTSFNLFVILLFFIVAGTILAVWWEVIPLYGCEIIIVLYSVHCLILFLLWYVCFFYLIFVACMKLAVWQEVIDFVWLCNDKYFISIKLIDSRFAQICILLGSILLIVDGMILAVSKKWLICMVEKLLLFYIKYTDWFFTSLNLYVVSFSFNCYSWYDIGSF